METTTETGNGEAKTNGEAKARNTPIEIVQASLARIVSSLTPNQTKLAKWSEALEKAKEKGADVNTAHLGLIQGAAECVNDALDILHDAVEVTNKLPTDFAVPRVSVPRSSKGKFEIDDKVEIREQHKERYAGLFEEGDEETFTVSKLTEDGKRAVCTSGPGLRMVFPLSHLKSI